MKGYRVNRRSLLIGMAAAPALIRAARAAPMTLAAVVLACRTIRSSPTAGFTTTISSSASRPMVSPIASTVQFFPDNQLGQEIDVVNSVSLGVIDLMVTGTSIWANVVPLIGLLDLGYLFESSRSRPRRWTPARPSRWSRR